MDRKKAGTAKASGQEQGRNDPHSRAGSFSGHMGGSRKKDGSRRQEIRTRIIPKSSQVWPPVPPSSWQSKVSVDGAV